MPRITLIEGVTMALGWEMEHDERVVVLGEDVGVNGGVFRATAGLQQRFGPDRVMDTPLAESMIAGMSIGMAAQGMRPVCEIQFMGFIYPTVDQMINHAGRLRNRTRGRLHVPMVLRAPFGGGIHAPEHHSESTEALFAHHAGHSRGHPVFPASRLRAPAGGDSRSRSGGVP
jgi:2-oxoisovalerate dehydrogenase E1 component beta subunit